MLVAPCLLVQCDTFIVFALSGISFVPRHAYTEVSAIRAYLPAYLQAVAENFSAGQVGAGAEDVPSRVSRLEAGDHVCVSPHPVSTFLGMPDIVMLLITLRGLNVDKHKTRLLKSLKIIMQHFSDYSPRDALHKANKARAGGLLLPWQRTTGHPVCEMHEHLRINLF